MWIRPEAMPYGFVNVAIRLARMVASIALAQDV